MFHAQQAHNFQSSFLHFQSRRLSDPIIIQKEEFASLAHFIKIILVQEACAILQIWFVQM